MAAAQQGDVIAGRYTLREELGRGGMGVVWLARDETLDREVAVKEVLLPAGLSDEEREQAHARVRREGQTAARVSHPAVVTVHDVFEYAGHPWVVMEFISGRSLQEHMAASGAVSLDMGRKIAESMLRALREAHRVGVAHRDIKPGNIMLAENDRVVLTDFGIAVVEGSSAITSTGTLIGSPEYMAPERMDGNADPYVSDLWSLGATLYHAIEGTSPFRRDTLTGTVSAVVAAPVPPPQYAGPLGGLLMRLLERDPEQRITIEQALELLEQSPPLPTSPPATAPVAAPPHWSPTGGTVTGPHSAPAAPPPTAPPGGYITGPRPVVPPPHNGHPSGPHLAAPAYHGAGGMSSPPPQAPPPGGQERSGRLLPALIGGVSAVVLVLVIITVRIVLDPGAGGYEDYEDEHFAVSHPAGWEREEVSEEELQDTEISAVLFRSPEDDMLIALDRFEAAHRSLQELHYSEDYLRSEYEDYERTARSDDPDTGLPAEWDTAFLEGVYSAADWPSPERRVMQMIVTVDDTAGFSLLINVPQGGEHDELVTEVLDSFEPQV